MLTSKISNEHTESINSEQLRTPHGQWTSNISFTRTNTVKKIFTPATNRTISAISRALPPSSPTRAHNQSSAQPSAQRQQAQRTTSRANPITNLNAHNYRGNGHSRIKQRQPRSEQRSWVVERQGGHGRRNSSSSNQRQNVHSNSGHQRIS
jgi:hypothetical protein